nr:MAG TPA: Receptor Binding Protein sandwich domain, phage receptor.75A [Caudoviricetes sp.]
MADFSGVTFAKQNVTPADDGLIRRALLSDGILTGCNFSYSGYTLSMRAGALIVCGRQIRHPSAQNWAVVGAKSGYARLVLDIDLTKSSTKELFEQVSTTLEYATDEAGFTELIQEDLNVSGSHYQIALCVVSLGEAGITGIVSQLDSAAGTGGNFSVVGGLTQPTSPKENMIWVKANVKKAPKYVFAVAAPDSPSEGLIWFLASSSGAITQASAYTDGAWVTTDAYMYLAGNWVQITAAWNGELFDNGNQYEDVTGGWSVDNSYYGGGSIGTAIVGGSGGNNSDQGSKIYTTKAILSGNYTKFKFVVTKASGSNKFSLKSGSISGATMAYHTFNGSTGTFAIAIPSGLPSFFPYLQTGSKGTCTITKVWLER